MTAPLIGFAGVARSGKDTAAQALLEFGWTRRAFADKVRDMLYAFDPYFLDTHNEVWNVSVAVDRYGWEGAKEQFPEIRTYQQELATEGGRAVLGENVWVDALFRDAETWGPTVITDVRFPNEAAAIRERGGLVVAIQRPGVEAGRHVSENALAGYLFDEVILNDGTPAQLHDRVMQLMPVIM